MKKRDRKLFYILLSLCFLYPTTTKSYAEEFKCLKPNNTSSNILEKTLAKNPKSKTAKLCCAKVYLKNGDFKEAENLLMQILEEDPSHKKANQLLKELNEAYSKHINNESLSETLTVVTPEPIDIIIEKEQTPPDNQIPNKVLTEEKKQDEKTYKLPTKEELLKKAKERKLAETKASTSKPTPKIDEKKQSNNLLNKKEENLLPIVSTTPLSQPTTGSESDSESNRESNSEVNSNILISPIILDNQHKDTSSEVINSQNNNIENSQNFENEKFSFTPYIANKNKVKKNNLDNKQIDDITSSITNNNMSSNGYLTDTSKDKFLESTKDSFLINLQQANCLIQKNKLKTAESYLDIALAKAIDEINNQKLSEVQLTRAMIYLYQCDFNKYGKHIFSIGKGLSDDVYKSLQKVYDTINKFPTEDLKLKYVANLAYSSGYYQIALDIINKLSSVDKETAEIAQKSQEILNSINGEYLLNNGSYLSSIDEFEKENDDVEKGRAYLAISKSLIEGNEPFQAKIAENFGISSLMNYIMNDPNQPKANLYLALYYLDKGNKNQAKEAIRRGLNAQGNNDIITSKLLNLSENL